MQIARATFFYITSIPLNSIISELYAGTMDVTQRLACMSAKIVIAGGLEHPPPWCGRRFSAVGQRVNK